MKSEFSYYEAKYQFKHDVLIYPNNYYNEWKAGQRTAKSTIIIYVSSQLSVDPNVFEFYSNRQNTIFEHFKDIKNIYGHKPFSEENYSGISKFLSTKYYQSDNSYFLIISCIEKLKDMKIILPGISKIEEIVSEIKVKSEETLGKTKRKY